MRYHTERVKNILRTDKQKNNTNFTSIKSLITNNNLTNDRNNKLQNTLITNNNTQKILMNN